MTIQTEAQLEQHLILLLQEMGYAFQTIKDEQGMLSNLKQQLEAFNNCTFSAKEMDAILLLDEGTSQFFDHTAPETVEMFAKWMGK